MAEGGGGGIVGILESIFQQILGGVDQNIQIAFNYTAAWLNNLLHNLVGLFKAIGGFFQAVWKFLKQAWEQYIKKALDWLIKHFRKWIDWLRQHVKSLIDHLKKWKKWYDQHILPFQLKQIALIQHIRQILGILKAFHVKWAQTLDQKLAGIQQELVGTIEIIRGALNSVINFANLIFDPSLLIRSTALGGSLLNMLGGLKRIAGFGSGLGMTKAQASQMQKDQQMYTKSTVIANVQTRAATGSTAEDLQARTDFQNALSAETSIAL